MRFRRSATRRTSRWNKPSKRRPESGRSKPGSPTSPTASVTRRPTRNCRRTCNWPTTGCWSPPDPEPPNPEPLLKRYRAIAAYYDADNERLEMLKHDVPFFMGQLPKKRQDILELAVGTGRAAIPLAQAGHRVVGVDYVEDMLAIARSKRDGVGLPEKQLKLVRQDALKLDLRQRFDWVVILFNTLLAFTTLDELDRVLQNVRRHMRPKGRFYLDVFNPDHERLTREREQGLDRDVFH